MSGMTRMARGWLVGVVLVVVMVGAVTIYYGWEPQSRYGERVDGPVGDYPAEIGSRAPERPSAMLPRATEPGEDMHGVDSVEDPIVLDGLRIASGNVLTAHNLRSGEEYWTYRREDADPHSVVAAGGALYVLWGDGLLVRFDPQAAEVVWRQEIGDPPMTKDLTVVGNTVVVVGQGASAPLRGYRVEDGRLRWETPQPACDHPSPMTIAGGVLVMSVECSREEPGDTPGVIGVDGESGEIRWQLEGVPEGRIVSVSDAQFAILPPRGRSSVFGVHDGQRGDVVTPPDGIGRLVGEGGMVVAYRPQARTSEPRLLRAPIEGWRLLGGTRAWTVVPDGTWALAGSPHVTDGLVYIVQRRLDRPGEFALAVYDLATGTERSRTDIPIPDEVRANPADTVSVAIHDAAAGVVSLAVSPAVDGGYPYLMFADTN